MSAISAQNVRHHPFTTSLASISTVYVLAAPGSEFVGALPGTHASLDIPDMEANSLVTVWEIRNNSADPVQLRFGPFDKVMTPAAGSTMSDFITLEPGVAYNFPVLPENQQINDQVGGADYSVLLLQPTVGGSVITGIVTVWQPTDG